MPKVITSATLDRRKKNGSRAPKPCVTGGSGSKWNQRHGKKAREKASLLRGGGRRTGGFTGRDRSPFRRPIRPLRSAGKRQKRGRLTGHAGASGSAGATRPPRPP